MKTTPRDQVLLMLMPAIFVVCVYVLLPIVSTAGQKVNLQGKLSQTEKQIADAKATAPTPEALSLKRLEAARLTSDISQLEKTKRELEQEWRNLQPGQVMPRSALSVQLGTLFNKHNVTIIGQELTESEDAALPASLKDALTALQSGKVKGRLLRLEVQGKYGDLLEALKDMAEAKTPAIPVSLVMEQASFTSPQRRWTLVLWL